MTRPLALLLLTLLLTSQVSAQPPTLLRFSCAVEPQNPVHGMLSDLFNDALAPLGYQALLVNLPQRRGLADAHAGQLDGDCARSPQLEDGQTEAMLRVPQSLGQFSLYGWSFNPAFTDIPAQTLLDGPYRLAYVRGNLAAEALIKNRSSGSTQGVVSPEQAIKMLAADRVDAVLSVRVLINTAQQALQPGKTLYASAPLSQVVAYPYLHPRHMALAAPMAAQMALLLKDPEHPLHQLSRD